MDIRRHWTALPMITGHASSNSAYSTIRRGHISVIISSEILSNVVFTRANSWDAYAFFRGHPKFEFLPWNFPKASNLACFGKFPQIPCSRNVYLGIEVVAVEGE